MNSTFTLTTLTAATLFVAAPFQESLQPAETPMDVGAAEQDLDADADADAWALALRSEELSERKASYEALLEAAWGDRAIREQLRTWAADEGQVELAWTAHLMLRELDAAPSSAPRPFGRSPFGGGFQLHAPSIDDEELNSLFDELRRLDPFQGLHEDLRRRGQPFQLDLDAFGPGLSMQSSGTSLEIGPDGVKLRVEETVDGQTETKTYEAESIEALLEAHPELEGKIGTSPGAPLPTWPRHAWPGPSPFSPPSQGGAQPFGGRALDGRLFGPRSLRPVEPSLDRLGIQMLPPEARQGSFPAVADDLGLEVVQVLPGTLAASVGIQPGELVISIDGNPIRSADDVRSALSRCSLDATIEIECVGADGKLRVRSWQPPQEGGARSLRTF